MATIGRYYFLACVEGAARRGHCVETLLRRSGIEPDWLDRPGWRGHVGAMADLVRRIRITMDDERMGFTARPVSPDAFAFAAELAWQGPSVREGLERAVRFYNLLGTDVLTTIADREDAVVLTSRFAEPEHDPRRYFREFWMITWHRLACWLLGETAPMQKAEFDYARPVYFDEFRHLFPTVHVFDTEQSALWIEARALSGPVRRTQAELEAMIAVAPLDIMTIPASDVSLGRRVRAILARDPAQSQAAIATELGLKEDALRRKLRLEGARISAVREDVRRDLSLRALTRTNRSIESIAEDLGYNEARSFTRAFRSWTGVSPSSYRRC